MEELKTSLKPEDLASSLNATQYIVSGMIESSVNTMLVVKVLKNNENGTIDVITCIQDLSNTNQPIDNYPIYGVRYMKWQYGTNLIDAEPSVGDIGILVVSKQDTSGLVKDGVSICQTKTKFNPADGIYIGGIAGLNATATQTIEFKANELNIKGNSTINISAPTVNIKDATAINLGTGASKKIALDGDVVKAGNTVVGNIVASSTIINGI